MHCQSIGGLGGSIKVCRFGNRGSCNNSVVSRVEKIKIQYDMLPKYCKKWKFQLHNEDDYRILHSELRKIKGEVNVEELWGKRHSKKQQI